LKQTRSATEEIARAAFDEIAARFPLLQIVEETEVPVGISLHLPVQEGLKHAVWLSLQNTDELHLAVGHFWCEWFPCTDSAKVSAFIEAVSGFLSGYCRSLEHYRGTQCVVAQLQRPAGEGWETIATWSRLRLPSFRKVSYKVLINA
jgi:hypothetical protein